MGVDVAALPSMLPAGGFWELRVRSDGVSAALPDAQGNKSWRMLHDERDVEAFVVEAWTDQLPVEVREQFAALRREVAALNEALVKAQGGGALVWSSQLAGELSAVAPGGFSYSLESFESGWTVTVIRRRGAFDVATALLASELGLVTALQTAERDWSQRQTDPDRLLGPPRLPEDVAADRQAEREAAGIEPAKRTRKRAAPTYEPDPTSPVPEAEAEAISDSSFGSRVDEPAETPAD